MPSRVKPVAGNVKEGRLYCENGYQTWVGERRIANGKWEERRFNGPRAIAEREWRAWREETSGEASIRVERKKIRKMAEEKGSPMPTATKTAAKQEKMYILSFKGQRSQKAIAAYQSEEAALKMAEALLTALEVSAMEGEYDVAEIPVWS